MNITVCYRSLSPSVRSRIAKWHGLADEEAERLPDRLSDADYLRKIREGMDEAEQAWMDHFTFVVGSGVWGRRDLGKQEGARFLPSVSLRVALLRLRQKGLVYAVRRAGEQLGHLCPEEVRRAWFRLRWGERKTIRQVSDVQAELLAGGGLYQDLFQFLILIHQQSPRLTQDGRLYKRTAQKWNAELEMETEALRYTPWDPIEEEDDQPPALKLVWHLAQDWDLVEVVEDRLVLREAVVREWLHLSERVAQRRLYNWVKRRLLQDDPSREAWWWWLEEMGRDWTPVEGGGNPMPPGRKPNLSQIRRWLRSLQVMGWVDLGRNGKRSYWRWSSCSPFADHLADTPDKGFVKPDFEVLIPFTFPMAERWRLAQFADYVGGDRMLTYLLTVGSVRRGIAQGMSTGEMLAALEQISVSPLPDNVRIGVSQWAAQAGRITFCTCVLLECQDERLADELEQHPEIGSRLQKRIGPATFRVAEGEIAQLQELLDGQGYPFLPGLVEETEQIWWRLPPPPSLGSAGSRFSDRAMREEGQLVDTYPEINEAVPGIQQLPRMWTSGLRAYHRTTVLDMVRKAAEWDLEMMATREGAGPVRFFPQQVDNVGGHWLIRGKNRRGEEKQWKMEELSAVQILIPDELRDSV
ncbi:helicase-associated domain-containing protein [Polycladomyces subterraneus]|uniref:Helicase-associated domain-containing protein n=1 Tax=Polycladomyces subterraneus TaxID=1016997 RepID=A0ABT8IR58_9BACL|nr:helicase-associated domain-containing protein [Polycladomyces subterraneus]MDN4595284.1 helicase-associated domain-containing protein [Polycladomyces subterraneus]